MYCFLANEFFIIRSEKDLEILKKKTDELNKALIIDMIFDSYISEDQFRKDNDLDEINKKIYATQYDPFIYERVNMGAANNFQIGYKKIGKLSQLSFTTDNTPVFITEKAV